MTAILTTGAGTPSGCPQHVAIAFALARGKLVCEAVKQLYREPGDVPGVRDVGIKE